MSTGEENDPSVVPDSVEPEPEPAAAHSTQEAPGAYLKKLREQRGLSLTELSDRTKITKAILSAMEDERYEDLPNARIYVWGFVRCFARELDLDMDEMAAAYVPRWEKWVQDNDIPVD
ncbi:MAG: helix-turn-helix transcriptional regulator [Myxococcota bacterium]